MSALAAIEAEALGGTEPVEVLFVVVDDELDEDGEETSTTHRFVFKSVRRWGASAFAALNAGAFDLWASKVLTDGTYETAWQVLDPYLEQITELVGEWEKASGDSLGKSRRSKPSSRSTRKR